MSYIVPSTLVYQQLANSGGVLNTTPDLETCIVGPAYNVLRYTAGSLASQISTAALSTTSTTGSIVSGAYSVTDLVSTAGFVEGDNITIIGAGSSGTNLIANITAIAGNTFTIDVAAGTTVTDVTVAKTAKIVDATIINTFELPGQVAGQTVESSSIVPWLDSAKVQTLQTGFYGYSGYGTIANNVPSGVTGTITGGTSSLAITTAAMATQWAVGDTITVAGAGVAAGLYTGTITNISGTTFTVTPAASTTATTQAVNKVSVTNLNSTTNTLRAEVGDALAIAYKNIAGTSTTFDTVIKSVVTSSGLNGTLTTFDTNDAMPEDMSSVVTTGTVGAASTALTVASSTGFSTGDAVWIYGAGASGGILESTITVSGLSWTLGSSSVAAVTNAVVKKVFRSTAAITSGATTFTMISGGIGSFAIGDRIVIVGAGANNSDLTALISNIVGSVVTFAPATVTSTTGATTIKKICNMQVSTRKLYSNQQLAATKPISGGSNFDTTSAGTDGTVAIQANPEVVYGPVITANVYFAYRALRTDLSGVANEFNSINDVAGLLGEATDENPLALALELALANTTGRVFAVGVATDDLAGHEAALNLLENQRMYCLVPLTQQSSIIAAYQAHVDQMSLPAEAGWRIVLANTAIPTTQTIGNYNLASPNANGGSNTITLNSGNYILTASNATFISDGVVAGDTINVTASTGSPTQVGTHTVLTVVSNQSLVISATGTGTAVSYYVTRTMTKNQQALAVAAASTTFGDKRVIHIQPDSVGVSVLGVTTYLPGYYLCAAVGGLISGLPVQQGLTNIGIAGIVDLKNSNFYFSKANLGTMAAAGTFIVAQATQGGLPYIRHELTTDISVLEYRELLVVKNWDFLSYYFKDKIDPFIGTWNITVDTLNIIRQTVNASASLLIGQKLPKIGAPLLSLNITTLEQDASNKDSINCVAAITVVYPNNYVNLYLVI